MPSAPMTTTANIVPIATASERWIVSWTAVTITTMSAVMHNAVTPTSIGVAECVV
jgi:hypothetical protein